MHLQSNLQPAASAESAPQIGYADYVGGRTVTGWALDMLALAKPLQLQAVIDGARVDEVGCALPRDDIRSAGIPCDVGGFRYAIPPDYLDGRPHVLRLELPGGTPISFPTSDGGMVPQHTFRIARADAGCSDLTELLRGHGILSDDFIKLFDVADYLALNGAAELSTSAQCIGHFARVGRPALCPISVECRFDPVFYSEIVPEAARFAPAAAYLHWLNVGLQDDIKPNRSRFLKSLGLARLGGMPPEFDPAIYRTFNPDLVEPCATDWGALRHAIWHGIPDGRKGCPPPDGHPELYFAAADRLAVADRLEAAKSIYEKALAAEPAHAAGLQHYGDCLLRMGDIYAAEQVYLRVVAAGTATIWTDLNLAKCRSQMGRLAEAALGLAQLRARQPGDVSIAAKARAAAASSFEEERAQARQLAARGFFVESRARMARAADLLVQPVRERLPDMPQPRGAIRSVALVADLSLPQCRFYRVDQKSEQLKSAGLKVQIFDQACDLDGFAGSLRFIDAVIFYRVAATPAVVSAIEAARTAGIVTFYEIDDLVFDPAHYPDGLPSYGGLVSPEEYGDLVTGTELFRAAMSLCDYALASTPSLAAMMQPHVRTGKAFVHRNGLGGVHLRHCSRPRALLPKTWGRRDGPIRIFYGTGTKAGNEDFARHAAPALDRLLQAHGDRVEFVVMGHLSLPDCLARHFARIRRLEPVWDMASYWAVLSGMDINIAALSDSVLSDCKSEIKWLEAAMLSIPSVLSPTATYREVVEDGVTGLLAASADTWFGALDRLVRDEVYREALGRAARDHVVAAYGPAGLVSNLRRIFAAVEGPDSAIAARRTRVLIVNVFFPPQDIGGATRVVADNVRDLVREHGQELEIEVFTTTEGGLIPYEMRSYVWHGVKVTAVTAGNSPKPDWEADDPRMGELFDRILDRFQPDLVHFHCIQRMTGAVCRVTQARGIPYFITVHDGWWISDHQFLLDDALQPSIYAHADPMRQLEAGGADSFRRMNLLAAHLVAARSVLAVSEPFGRIYQACGLSNVTVVANGVPDLDVAPRTRSPDRRVRLAHIGGAAPHKGYNLLRAVLATQKFDNLSLTVVDHALQPGMEGSEVWGSVPVSFRARTAQAEVGSLYAEVDVLVAPSVWPESYGLVTREALRAGCWVIASDRGAVALDVTPENGFVVDVGSAGGLRDVLAQIDASPERYRQPPACPPPSLRHSREQADELASLYLDSRPLAFSDANASKRVRRRARGPALRAAGPVSDAVRARAPASACSGVNSPMNDPASA